MKRIEIIMNHSDDRNTLATIFALKGWKTWIEQREPKQYHYYGAKDFVVCCEVPEDVIKDN